MKQYVIEGLLDGKWVNAFPPNHTFNAEKAILHYNGLKDSSIDTKFRIREVK